MRKTTIEKDGNSVTLKTDDVARMVTGELLEMVYDAMLGAGYHPTCIAEGMIDMGEQRLPKETQ